MIEWIVIILYTLSLSYIFTFSLVQLNLTFHYLKSKKSRNSSELINEIDWPKVTIQLPIYNEKYVVTRLLESIDNLDYPTNQIEIQVLDDSSDETSDIIKSFIKGKDKFLHIQRIKRTGYKAGALEEGMRASTGEFIAIFDSDFLPKSDFLKRTISKFDESTGMIQTRWGHVNRNYSLLTKLQALGLDAHFSIEQSGRSHAGSFISFNGTGGVWRKKCIEEAGGWSSDTLTEDLDLSYRAQLKGWKFKYDEDYEAPAELPVIMPAIKSQQYRWNKGAAETARKLLPSIFKSSLSPINKIHAVFHLLNSSVFVFLLFAAVLSIPMLSIKKGNPELELLFNFGSIFLVGFFSIAYFYWVSIQGENRSAKWRNYIFNFPLFLIVSMGLSLHNAIAVIEGLLGIRSPFIRTPKFNVRKSSESWKGNKYVLPKITTLTVFEGLLALYFVFGIWLGYYLNDWGLMIFHLMLITGFGMVFIYSLNPLKKNA